MLNTGRMLTIGSVHFLIWSAYIFCDIYHGLNLKDFRYLYIGRGVTACANYFMYFLWRRAAAERFDMRYTMIAVG